ncbi:3-hydroxyacyl-CoA dehydrogenase NAD-binding domain-containing protein [Dokdonella sp.]|uniref:3-hydroxyacyl-CoA dehydrogenase NAD-binding domain-containing protein n=1 Tax=Dokdonella sp. TaxID=2291710 RepID=UPI0035293184
MRSPGPARSWPTASTLDVDRSRVRRPQDVVGMHFFSPANVMKLLEVMRREDCEDVLATVMALPGRFARPPSSLRCLRRLYRQPHDRTIRTPGRLPA